MTDEDEALLDGVLAGFVAELKAGREPDPDAALPARPDLLGAVLEMLALAREVAPKRAAAPRPVVAGHEVIRELGRGGMAHVYLARDRRLARTVALKVLPRRSASPRAKDRFLREARAVARLDHPLIVPVHETGEDDGQPWFTMRYVDGRTLAQTLAAARASGVARDALSGADLARAAGVAGTPPQPWRGTWAAAAVRVAIDVCEALSHAHANGVVHRDVKPSNVMLRSDGFALLFDFGLADVEDEATLTLSHGFLGTPHYASPEQAAGGAGALDARSDVFSLASTLYEAITLELPFPGPTTHEVLRRVQTWEPEPPTRLVAGLPAGLDDVILHAMEKDPGRRYATVAELADDLRAVLDGRRVRAKRAGMLERGLRMVKRNRALTELLVEQQARNAELRAAVLRAERNEKLAHDREVEASTARRDAEAARRSAEASLAFIRRTLSSADPSEEGRDVRVADVLVRGFERTATDLAADPAAQAEIRATILDVLLELGREDDVVRLGRIAYDASRVSPGARHPASIEIAMTYGTALAMAGDGDAAVPVYAAGLETMRSVLGPDDPRTLRRESEYGQVLDWVGRREEALPELRRSLVRCRDLLGPDDPSTLRAEHNLGLVLSYEPGRIAESIEILSRNLDARRRVLGSRNSETVSCLVNLAQLKREAEGPLVALDLIREAATASADLLGPGHRGTRVARHNLAGALLDLGRIDEAEPLQTEVAAWARAATLPADPLRTSLVLQEARVHAAAGRSAAAESAAREALATSVATASTGWIAAASVVLADILAASGRPAESDRVLADAAATCRAYSADLPPRLAEALASRRPAE